MLAANIVNTITVNIEHEQNDQIYSIVVLTCLGPRRGLDWEAGSGWSSWPP